MSPGITPFRLFTVINGGNLTLKNHTLKGGDVSGNSGGSTGNYIGNQIGSSGGCLAVNSGCTLTLKNVTVQNSKGQYGGGIINNGTLSMENCTISANTSVLGGSGAYLNSSAAITSSTISNNSSTNDMGREVLLNTGTLTISNSIIATDAATSSGSDFYNVGGTVVDNGFNVIKISDGYTWTAAYDWLYSTGSNYFVQNTTSSTGNLYLGTNLGDNGGGINTLDFTDTNSVAQSIIFPEKQILAASDKNGNFNFGNSTSVSSDGSTMVIGAFHAPSGGYTIAGQAYVFKYNSGASQWEQKQILYASDRAANANFGYSTSVSSDGSTIIIGALIASSGGYDQAGQAYVFKYNSGTNLWEQIQILYASDRAANASFGKFLSVSSDGSTIIIGANGASSGGKSTAGQAYVFKYNSGTSQWEQSQILYASDRAANANFGYSTSVSSDGSTIIIGANGASSGGYVRAGQAYVFKYNSGTSQWEQSQILYASDRAANARFGYNTSMSSDGSTMVIGAYTASSGGKSTAGQAYVFKYNSGTSQWEQSQILYASDRAAGAYFGNSTSVSSGGSTLVIGANTASSGGYSTAGQAYVFKYNSGTSQWEQSQILYASDRAVSAQFGYSVSVSSDGSSMVIGAYTASSGGFNGAGQAYVFMPWNDESDSDARNYNRSITGTRTIGAYEIGGTK